MTALDNGFLAYAQPDTLQTVCHSLSDADVDAFFTRWHQHLPLPLTRAHHASGFTYQLSILQAKSV